MERRYFSAALQGQNLRFTGAGEGGSARARVGFSLLEHFPPPAFNQVLDTLATANLIRSKPPAVSNFSLSGEPMTSDLGLLTCPDLALASTVQRGLDLLVVYGGLRTPLHLSAILWEALQDVVSCGATLVGLWNGAWFLGDAGLLDDYRCCIHPEHRTVLAEIARNSQVISDSYIVDRNHLTAASPTGVSNPALEWITRCHGRDLVEAVVGILAFEESR